MNIVVSERLQEQLTAADPAVKQNFARAIALLRNHSRDRATPCVAKLPGTSPEIFVLKAGLVRYFFVYDIDNIVLLGLTTRESSERPDWRFIDGFRLLPKGVQQSEVDSKIADSHYELIDSPEAADEMANTNASGWYVDDYHVEDIRILDHEIRVAISWHATGDQDEDRPWCGDEMEGKATAVIDTDGNVTYQDISAQIVDPDDDRD